MQFALPSCRLSPSFGRPGSRGRKMASDGELPRNSTPTTKCPCTTPQAAALPPPPPHAGCQPVEWSGRGGFTHLLHHPGFVKTETYGSASETERIGLRPPRCRRRPATSRGHSSSSLLSLFVRARPGPAGAGGASGGQQQRQGRRPHRGVEGAGASGLCRRANACEPAACRRRCCHSSVALPGPVLIAGGQRSSWVPVGSRSIFGWCGAGAVGLWCGGKGAHRTCLPSLPCLPYLTPPSTPPHTPPSPCTTAGLYPPGLLPLHHPGSPPRQRAPVGGGRGGRNEGGLRVHLVRAWPWTLPAAVGGAPTGLQQQGGGGDASN